MKPLDDTGQGLAVEAVDRARKIAERYARLRPQYADDFESSAYWGVMRAASSYDPEGGKTWARWSAMAASGEIKDFLDGSYVKRRKLWPQDVLERVEDESGTTTERESADALQRLLDLLPPKYKGICELVYKEALSPYSAGQSLGMTGDHGCRLHRKALDYLRSVLVA